LARVNQSYPQKTDVAVESEDTRQLLRYTCKLINNYVYTCTCI
jgi:hypothetical protein